MPTTAAGTATLWPGLRLVSQARVARWLRVASSRWRRWTPTAPLPQVLFRYNLTPPATREWQAERVPFTEKRCAALPLLSLAAGSGSAPRQRKRWPSQRPVPPLAASVHQGQLLQVPIVGAGMMAGARLDHAALWRGRPVCRTSRLLRGQGFRLCRAGASHWMSLAIWKGKAWLTSWPSTWPQDRPPPTRPAGSHGALSSLSQHRKG